MPCNWCKSWLPNHFIEKQFPTLPPQNGRNVGSSDFTCDNCQPSESKSSIPQSPEKQSLNIARHNSHEQHSDKNTHDLLKRPKYTPQLEKTLSRTEQHPSLLQSCSFTKSFPNPSRGRLNSMLLRSTRNSNCMICHQLVPVRPQYVQVAWLPAMWLAPDDPLGVPARGTPPLSEPTTFH